MDIMLVFVAPLVIPAPTGAEGPFRLLVELMAGYVALGPSNVSSEVQTVIIGSGTCALVFSYISPSSQLDNAEARKTHIPSGT